MAKKAAAAVVDTTEAVPEYALGLNPGVEPTPFAIKWKDSGMETVVPAGGLRYRLVSGQFSPICPYDGHFSGAGRLRVEVEDKGTTPPIPVPVPPTISTFLALPASIQPAQMLTVSVGLLAPQATPQSVQVTTPWNLSAQVNIPAGSSAGQTLLTVPATAQAGAATLKATLGASSKETTVQVVAKPPDPEPIPIPPIPPIPPTPTPGPVPITRTIDLTGKTQVQIQAAINAAQPGDGLYLGPGAYSFPASMGSDGQGLDITRDGITLFGAGPATVLSFEGREGIWCRRGGQIGKGNVIRDLAIRSARRAVVALDPQRLFVQRVSMTAVSHGYASERTGAYDNAQYKWPVVIQDCTVSDWGSQGMYLHGGETIQRCRLVDALGGSTYSHGLYLQGVTDLIAEDILLENVPGHAFQIYSDQSAHAANGADNIIMRRITCRNCNTGPIIAANGKYTNITIEDLTVTGTVSRNSGTIVISATNDMIENLRMRNVMLDGGGEGLILQGGQTGEIKGLLIDNLSIRNHNTGIVVGPAGWPYTKITGSRIDNYQAPGVPLPVRGTSPGLIIT
jgi:hypothetical protein